MATKFQRIRSLTLPVMKINKGETRYFGVISAMKSGDQIDKTKEPATLLHCVDMETGEEGNVIVPQLLRDELNKSYPDATYVGRGFEITITRDMEKKYNHVSVAEVAIPEETLATMAELRSLRSGNGAASAGAASNAPAPAAKSAKR